MRVLHVTPYWESAWAYGGIPRVVGRLSHGLASRGHHVAVATTDAYDRDRRLGPEAPADIELNVFRNVSNRLAYDLQAFAPIGFDAWLRGAAARFDVGHIHACHNWPGATAALHLARAGVPYVVAPNGTAPRIERRRLLKWAFDATVGRRLLPRAARVVATSEAERRQLLAHGVAAERVRIIPNPVDEVDHSRLDPAGFRARHAIPATAELVVYLGKLTPRKRADVLVDAFARLDRPDSYLAIAGNDLGSGEALRRRVQARDLASRTRFTGLLTGHARFDALAAANVVAYPGEDEVFGLVALEALLCERPVVVANDSGCAEVVSAVGGGVTVPPRDPAALALAIGGLLDDPTRTPTAGLARRVHRRYGVEATTARWEELYAEVARRPAAARARS